MITVRGDYVPATMSMGEINALASAGDDGWLHPPARVAWQPEQPRSWRTAHCQYLKRRGLITHERRRRDGLFSFRLNDDGMAARAALLNGGSVQ